MTSPSSSTRDLARQLLVASQTASGPHESDAAEDVRQRLRIALTSFVGAEGFASLMKRAVVLAREEVPALHSIRVGDESHLLGFELLEAGPVRDEAFRALMAHFIGLLVTFVGRPLTLSLLRATWPGISLKENEIINGEG